jgi:hypothetical protein
MSSPTLLADPGCPPVSGILPSGYSTGILTSAFSALVLSPADLGTDRTRTDHIHPDLVWSEFHRQMALPFDLDSISVSLCHLSVNVILHRLASMRATQDNPSGSLRAR